MADQQQYRIVDKYDRAYGAMKGLPDVTWTAPATRRVAMPIIGATQTFIVQTARQREIGDTIYLEYVDETGAVRIVIPPVVANAIAAQRDALTTKVRKKAAKAQAAERKARGEVPAFLKVKKA